MMVPEAYVSHRTLQRVRIRIPSLRGDRDSLQKVGDELQRSAKFERIVLNPQTGSVLLEGVSLDVEKIANYGEDHGLFSLRRIEAHRAQPVTLSERVAEPIGWVSDFLGRSTGGVVDLPGLIFLSLLGFGGYEILRGNWRSPPWYTAFWYAFGVFTKSLADKASKAKSTTPNAIA